MGTLIGLGAGFAALGVLLMGAGVATLLRARRDAAGRLSTWGTVAELRPRAGLRGAIQCPVVRFQTETGQQVMFHSSVGGQPPLHAVGQRVAVYYARDSPAGAELEAPGVLWLVPAGFIALGLFFAAIGAMALLGFGLLAVSGGGTR
jgi:hypothetical protein